MEAITDLICHSTDPRGQVVLFSLMVAASARRCRPCAQDVFVDGGPGYLEGANDLAAGVDLVQLCSMGGRMVALVEGLVGWLSGGDSVDGDGGGWLTQDVLVLKIIGKLAEGDPRR